MSWNGWGWSWQQQPWGSSSSIWWSRPSEQYADWWSLSKATEELGRVSSGDGDQSKAFHLQQTEAAQKPPVREPDRPAGAPGPASRPLQPPRLETAENARSLVPAEVTPTAHIGPAMVMQPKEPAQESGSSRTKHPGPPLTGDLSKSLSGEEWWLGVDDATRRRLTEELRNWLRGIHPSFTSYFKIMEDNYDSVDQICRLYIVEEEDGDPTAEKRLDPLFFEDNDIKDPEHQQLFRHWFASEYGLASGRDSSGGGSSSSASKASNIAASPTAKAQNEQAAALPAPHPADGAGGFRSSGASAASHAGEDPWTTGKDPWAAGREDAARRSRSQPPFRTAMTTEPARTSGMEPRPCGTQRASSLRPAARAQAAGPTPEPTGGAPVLGDRRLGGGAEETTAAAKSAEAVATGHPEMPAISPQLAQFGGGKGSSYGASSRWGDSAWSPDWSGWSWSWSGWNSRSSW